MKRMIRVLAVLCVMALAKNVDEAIHKAETAMVEAAQAH